VCNISKRRKQISHNLEFTVFFLTKVNLSHLIDEVFYSSDSIEHCGEKLDFDLASHSARTVCTDQTSVNRNICVLSLGPGLVGRSTKIDAVSRDKRPVLLKNQIPELPVFPASLAQPGYMGAVMVTVTNKGCPE
jgi:hypothetical protein